VSIYVPLLTSIREGKYVTVAKDLLPKLCFLFACTNGQREWWVTSCSEFKQVTKGKEK